MLLKKILPLMFFTIFIQSSSQQAQAITEQQANIASYIVGAGAGTATGTGIFLLLERYDAQQQKEAQEHVIVENDNSDLITIESTENKDKSHHIRNLIIGAACGVVVGVITYKISHDVIMPHVITPEVTDQKTSFYEIRVFIRDKEGGVAHEIQVPDEFMIDNSLEKRADFFKWIKETYKNSYECKYTEFTKKDGFLSGKSTNLVINPHNK